MPFLFSNRTKILETQIDKYLDAVSKSGLIFYMGVKNYLNNNFKDFEKNFKEISALETKADELRRDIKTKLYTYMLIPESRGDVLGLLETLDDVVDICETVIKQLSIEHPEIPDFIKNDFLELSEFSQKSVEELAKGARAFFKEINMVNDYVNKVHFYEHEADGVEEQLKRKVFGTDKISRFSRKIHMRYFAEKIASVSDVAEDVAERLAVYAIKRRI